MLYDCFIFFNELDLLEIRLNEFKDVDCKHVIVESDKSHTGNPKPFNLTDNWDRFKEFHNKIIYLKLNSPDRHINPWQRESTQRNFIMEGLRGANDDDLVIISDVDEIPRASSLMLYNPNMGIIAIHMVMSYYFVNCVSSEEWTRARILTYGDLKKYSPEAARCSFCPTYIAKGGWHFSYLGGAGNIIEKIENFCHTNLNNSKFTNREYVQDKINMHKDLYGRDIAFRIQPLDDTYPDYIVSNQDRFSHLITKTL